MSYKGFFKPKNPSKYVGDPTNIIYRSNLELRFMLFLDSHPSIKSWQSEELWIPYIHPKDKRVHRYFPDFIVESVKENGETITEVIEVKPYKQTIEPVMKRDKYGKVSKQFIRDAFIWAINDAKWKAARQYCTKNNYTFRQLTEKDLKV